VTRMGCVGGRLSCATGLTGLIVAGDEGSGPEADLELRFDLEALDESIEGSIVKVRRDVFLEAVRE